MMRNMKGIYLCSRFARHPNYNIVYNDIDFNCSPDILADCRDVNLEGYDFIICTPPCNYWSRANYRRNFSLYALNTWMLLPEMIEKLIDIGKPFIVENVRNSKLFNEYGLFNYKCFIYFIGRHTYWTNIMLPYVKQSVEHIKYLSREKRDNTKNVYEVIEIFLDYVKGEYEKK